MPAFVISVDIGSTWTKGALIDLENPRSMERQAVATTVDDLTRGFNQVNDALKKKAHTLDPGSDAPELFLSSSAKGGLRVVAVGIVPELTLQAATLAAASAGAKIVGSFAYKLKGGDLERMAALQPDIVLLAGGTEGGDESYILHNARALARSTLDAAVVYAGNSAVREDALAILSEGNKRCIGAENILPELDRLAPESARVAIADLFIELIVEGRGLSVIAAQCSVRPRPTPAAVFDLVALLETQPSGGNPNNPDFTGGLLLIDLGGATTDVYSACEPFVGESGTVFHGIPEPRVKRTVEGDLGMRVSAANVFELAQKGKSDPSGLRNLEAWVARLADAPEMVAANSGELALDRELATICTAESIRRHSGTMKPNWGVNGISWVQKGKDLRKVRTVIASGGMFAAPGAGDVIKGALTRLEPNGYKRRTGGGAGNMVGSASGGMDFFGTGEIPLLPNPHTVRILRDASYMAPIAANLAVSHPKVAKELMLAALEEEKEGI